MFRAQSKVVFRAKSKVVFQAQSNVGRIAEQAVCPPTVEEVGTGEMCRDWHNARCNPCYPPQPTLVLRWFAQRTVSTFTACSPTCSVAIVQIIVSYEIAPCQRDSIFVHPSLSTLASSLPTIPEKNPSDQTCIKLEEWLLLLHVLWSLSDPGIPRVRSMGPSSESL